MEFAKDWRKRHIAHRDLDLALRKPTSPLPGASRAQVKAALGGLVVIYNLIEGHYFQSTTIFNRTFGSRNAQQLLYVLHAGLNAQAARIERLRRGEQTAEDLHPPDL